MQRRSARVSAITNDAVHEGGGLELRTRDDEEKTTEEQPDIQTDERARRSSATFTSFASSGAGAVARTGYEHASFSDAGKVEFGLGEPEDLQFGDALAWLREHKFDESLEVADSDSLGLAKEAIPQGWDLLLRSPRLGRALLDIRSYLLLN